MPELHLILRTPEAVPFDGPVQSVRFPTPTGQVGVRQGAEAFITAMEPGLVLIQVGDTRHYAGTAGGVARQDGAALTLFSPFAAVGTAEEVLTALAAARSDDEGELAALRSLSELEQRITSEVRGGHLAGETP